jgi:hypothetical protein
MPKYQKNFEQVLQNTYFFNVLFFCTSGAKKQKAEPTINFKCTSFLILKNRIPYIYGFESKIGFVSTGGYGGYAAIYRLWHLRLGVAY